MRTLIFVVGMGRSGTSALTRLVAMSGAALPDTVSGPGVGNPTGHWEPSLALRINELYLSFAGSSFWDTSLRLQSAPRTPTSDRAKFVEKIKWFLKHELRRGDLFVLKDPRISVLLDCWLTAASQAGFSCKVIHVFRHPEEVAASLRTRDQFDRDASYLLWIKYNLLGERYARNRERVFLSYEKVLGDWKAALQTANHRLDLNLELPSAHSVRAFLSPQRRHHTSPVPVVDDPTPGLWAARVFAILKRALAEEVDTAGMDRVFDEFAIWAAQRGGADRVPTLSRLLNALRYTRPGLHVHRWRQQVRGATERKSPAPALRWPQGARSDHTA